MRAIRTKYKYAFVVPNEDKRVPETDGWKDLVLWLETAPAEGEPKHTTTWLARQLNVSQPAVRGWVARISRPTEGPLRDALCRLIGSSSERWITEADRAEAARLATVGVAPARGAA